MLQNHHDDHSWFNIYSIYGLVYYIMIFMEYKQEMKKSNLIEY